MTETTPMLGGEGLRPVSLIGYARVSTRDQNPKAQEAELRAFGCVKVFVDHGVSSRIKDRPEWLRCLDYMREGDTLVVRKMDRLAGTDTMALETLRNLGERGIDFRSLTEPAIDTTTAMGRALFGVAAVFLQLRVDAIRENTMAGLAHARSQGRVGGRPTVMTPDRVDQAVRMREDGKPITHIARILGVGASSVTRALAKAEESRHEPVVGTTPSKGKPACT